MSSVGKIWYEQARNCGEPWLLEDILRRIQRKLAYLVSKRRFLELTIAESCDFPINLRHPRSFNDKLNAYKLDSYGNRIMPQLVDKIRVKNYVADKIGPEYVIPTLWHGTRLPPREQRTWSLSYVIKSSHGWAQNIFVRSEPDWDDIEVKVARWLKLSHGLWLLEWPYLRVERALLIEPYIVEGDALPIDYKFFVFEGKVRMIQVDEERAADPLRTMLNTQWQPFEFTYSKPRRPANLPEQPPGLSTMIEMAETLAAELPFVRVDLYNLGGRILFGEMTFFPCAGIGRFDPPEADRMVGDWWPYEPEAVRQACYSLR